MAEEKKEKKPNKPKEHVDSSPKEARRKLTDVQFTQMDPNGGLYHFHPRPTAFMREDQPLFGQYVAEPSVIDEMVRVNGADYLVADYLIYDNDGVVVVLGA